MITMCTVRIDGKLGSSRYESQLLLVVLRVKDEFCYFCIRACCSNIQHAACPMFTFVTHIVTCSVDLLNTKYVMCMAGIAIPEMLGEEPIAKTGQSPSELFRMNMDKTVNRQPSKSLKIQLSKQVWICFSCTKKTKTKKIWPPAFWKKDQKLTKG